MKKPARTFLVAMMATVGTTLCFVAPANAGRLVVTGHDSDHHCAREKPEGQCHFFGVATTFVRGGAPSPGKPVLIFDRGALDAVVSLDKSLGTGVPRVVIDPRKPEFKTMPINTNLYSAILIASSKAEIESIPQDLNEFFSAPDSAAINARAGDIGAFFDAGGGIFANSGGRHGDEPGDPHYRFLPIPVAGEAVAAPFKLTAIGRQIGFGDGTGGTPNDINCCRTHNSFDFPSPSSPLKVAETDSAGGAETLVARETTFGELGADPNVIAPVTGVERGKNGRIGCLRRRFLRFRLREPRGVDFKRVVVFANWRRVRTIGDRRILKPFRLTVRGRGGKFRVRFAITTTDNRRLNVRRTFRVCATKRKGRKT